MTARGAAMWKEGWGWAQQNLGIQQEADEVGISVHIISRENIPQTIFKALQLKIKLDDNIQRDPKAALAEAAHRDKLYAQIEYYMSVAIPFGGMLAVAHGKKEEFHDKILQAIRDAYETPIKGSHMRPDSTFKGYVEKHYLLKVGRFSGSSVAVQERNYQSLAESGQRILADYDNFTTYGLTSGPDITAFGFDPPPASILPASILPQGIMPTSGPAGHKPDLSRGWTPQLEVRPPSLKVGMISGNFSPAEGGRESVHAPQPVVGAPIGAPTARPAEGHQEPNIADMDAKELLDKVNKDLEASRSANQTFLVKSLNFPAWVRGDGKEIITEQLMRLSKPGGEEDTAKKKKRVEGKMAEMSAPEKSEYSFGVYVEFVVELVNDLWDRKVTTHLSDAQVFPLPRGEGNMGSRGEAAAMFTDSYYNMWESRFGGGRPPFPPPLEPERPRSPRSSPPPLEGEEGDADAADAEALRQELRNRGGRAP